MSEEQQWVCRSKQRRLSYFIAIWALRTTIVVGAVASIVMLVAGKITQHISRLDSETAGPRSSIEISNLEIDTRSSSDKLRDAAGSARRRRSIKSPSRLSFHSFRSKRGLNGAASTSLEKTS